jgi:hypothetical protein
MRTIRFRVTGPIDPVQALLKRISSIDDIDRVEEVADTGSHLREDSTSLNLPDDLGHTDFHDIEVHALSDTVARAVKREVERATRDLGLVAEFVDEW